MDPTSIIPMGIVTFWLLLFAFIFGIGIGYGVGIVRGREDIPSRQDRLNIEAAKLKAVLSSLDAVKAEVQSAKRPIPADVWKKLVKIAHPDHNDGSELSTEVTAWLLQHRPK